MIRRPPRSTLFPYTDALPISCCWLDRWRSLGACGNAVWTIDRKSTRLNSSHQIISYAVFCLKKKNKSQKSVVAHNHLPTITRQFTTRIDTLQAHYSSQCGPGL